MFIRSEPHPAPVYTDVTMRDGLADGLECLELYEAWRRGFDRA